MRATAVAATLLVLAGVTVLAQRSNMDTIAEQYVRLVLGMGVHEADYVDAYYGPSSWRTAAEEGRSSLQAIGIQADVLARQLNAMAPSGGPADLGRLRHQYLSGQVAALRARVAMRTGRKMTFDEESKAFYDAVAPVHTETEFDAVRAQLEAVLPGADPLQQRLEDFRSRFVIPRDRLEQTFAAAIAACRARTLRHIELPKDERFTVEYVTNQSWSAYNWYQGDYRSVIHVNTDLPVRVDGAIDLACHEGYPGHHVYNVLLEKNLTRGRKWMEFSVYPLFSPQSLIAEGTANYGIDVTFPAGERLRFEQDVIFPAAGLDPATAPEYYRVVALLERFSYAGNEAARRYLDGRMTAAATADWLERYALMSRARAEQRVRFIDQYRSYVINYNLGKDMVGAYLTRRVGDSADASRMWQEFERLLSSPRLPSGLGAP
ncbi:MAG: hypothetical protein ABL986_02295 [Vicinamibacterales bacterium]